MLHKQAASKLLERDTGKPASQERPQGPASHIARCAVTSPEPTNNLGRQSMGSYAGATTAPQVRNHRQHMARAAAGGGRTARQLLARAVRRRRSDTAPPGVPSPSSPRPPTPGSGSAPAPTLPDAVFFPLPSLAFIPLTTYTVVCTAYAVYLLSIAPAFFSPSRLSQSPMPSSL